MSTPWSSDQTEGDRATPDRNGKTQPDGPGGGGGGGGGVVAGRRGRGVAAWLRPVGSDPPLSLLWCTIVRRRSVVALAGGVEGLRWDRLQIIRDRRMTNA